jgi:hypothetical protein
MSFTRQTQVRATLIRLGGLLLLLILINSLAGLAAVRYTKQAALQDLGMLAQIEQAQAQAQSALVHFKTQVQEWKNILLRGDEPDDLARYRAAFSREIEIVEQSLRALAADAAAAGLVNIATDEVIEAHQALKREYETALSDFIARQGADPRRTDAEVRGIDRELSEMIDQISASAAEQAARLRAEITRSATERYDTLFFYSAIAALVIAGLVVAILLTALSSIGKT